VYCFESCDGPGTVGREQHCYARRTSHAPAHAATIPHTRIHQHLHGTHPWHSTGGAPAWESCEALLHSRPRSRPGSNTAPRPCARTCTAAGNASGAPWVLTQEARHLRAGHGLEGPGSGLTPSFWRLSSRPQPRSYPRRRRFR